MTNILGNSIVIIDSDALIGLINEDDKLHERCLEISEYLVLNNSTTIVPYPIVLEAATTLARDNKISRPDLAAKLLLDYAEIDYPPELSLNVGRQVSEFYNPKTSKKNTPFDHYLLALAKENNIQYVFSFDSFYKKNGLTLVEDLVKK